MQIHFDEASHIYFLNGIVTPSVTEVIRAAGQVNTQWCSEEDRDRGTEIHANILELIKTGKTKTRYPDHIEAWKRFRDECEVRVLDAEKIVHSREYGFAGRLDIRCDMFGVSSCVLDIKTGIVADWVRLQVAGYRIALKSMGVETRGGFAVHLRADGTYKVTEFARYQIDRAEFLSIVKTVRSFPQWNSKSTPPQVARQNSKRLAKRWRRSVCRQSAMRQSRKSPVKQS